MPGTERPEYSGQIFIHIGWHKSASTYLQEGFFQQIGINFQPLKQVPTQFAGRAPQQDSLIHFVESPSSFDASLMRSMTLPIIESDRDQTTIISHEQISGHPHGYAIIDPAVSARNLASAYPNARIIAVIRNQWDYILSLYAYRVSIRGHETRSFSRFVTEDGAKGLISHIEYDQLIGQYVDLFGASNILILPVEMLKSAPDQFFSRLSHFIGQPAPTEMQQVTSNESTRLKMVLHTWIPLNTVFSYAMKLTLRVLGKNPADYEPDKKMIYPFISQRLRYYRFKRRMTALLNRIFKNGRELNKDDIPGFEDLELVFSKSNRRLTELGVVDWDMHQFGYPLSDPLNQRSEPTV